MSGTVLFEEKICVPFLASLQEFRQWMWSDQFPKRGRIDYIAGQIEVDTSPEDLFTHNSVKAELGTAIYRKSKQLQSGVVFIGRARVACHNPDLSIEPDVVYLSHDTVDEGLVKFVPRSSEEPVYYIEIEGPPDLIVEIVGDASVGKDTTRLPKRYFQAGVRELWLVDARPETINFTINSRGKRGFVAVAADKRGFICSKVLGAHYRLDFRRDRKGWPLYELIERE